MVSHPHAQYVTTLRLTDWADLKELELTKETLNEFHRRYPHIRVMYEPSPGREYEPKILASLAANEAPDVFLLDSKLLPTFTNKKILLDLSPYFDEFGIDTTMWFPNVRAIAQKNNAYYALPKGFTPLMVYYNKDVFVQAGLPFPSSDWTWNDYLELAKKLTRDVDGDGKIDIYGTSFDNRYFYWIPWVWSAGGDVVSPDGNQATGYLNSPRTEEALKFLIDLRTLHHVAPETGTWIQTERTGAQSQLFAAGKIAMHVDGHWRLPALLPLIESGKLNIGVIGLPAHPRGGKVNVMYESGWCVPVSTKHPREAALLAAFMSDATANSIRSTRRLELPAVVSVAQSLAENDTLGLERAFFEEVRYCRQPWGSIIERFSEIERVLQDAVDEVLINRQPLHETMTRYAGMIDRMLENIRQHQDYEFRPIREHTEIVLFLLVVTLLTFLGATMMYLLARRNDRRSTRHALLFLSPSLLHLIFFVFTPIAFAAYLSLHRWDIVVADKPFIGLENFREMLSDDAFWNAVFNTLIYSLNVPISMSIALAVAVMLNRRLTGMALLRTLYFLPSITSFVAIALVWMWMYHPSYGMANFVLSTLGLSPLPWLNSPETAMISIIIFSVWLSMGYQMVIFLAGLQGIPRELLDAARIDGAGSFQRFWRVTFPLLKPTTFFILVTSLISSFQVFTTIYVMTAGGPVKSTDVIVYHIYQAAWEQLRMGYASALSWVLFVLVVIATWIQFKVGSVSVEYS
jgi:ABC-type sugar transport system permease subunit/ABC-type glycerol-3-phosphate transport system substrate-binding protein